jgi:hypothetical protein
MKILMWLLLSTCLLSCQSTPNKTNAVEINLACGKTPVTENDMQTFGFEPAPGKVVVMRIFATWCPFCKTDLGKISEHFKSGEWKPEQVNVFLLAYKNHSESKATYDKFVKEKLAELGLPSSSFQIHYIDHTYPELLNFKTAAGIPYFTGWNGVPFALLFGKDGRMAFRGHFTMSDKTESEQYKMITQLAGETCP